MKENRIERLPKPRGKAAYWAEEILGVIGTALAFVGLIALSAAFD